MYFKITRMFTTCSKLILYPDEYLRFRNFLEFTFSLINFLKISTYKAACFNF